MHRRFIEERGAEREKNNILTECHQLPWKIDNLWSATNAPETINAIRIQLNELKKIVENIDSKSIRMSFSFLQI